MNMGAVYSPKTVHDKQFKIILYRMLHLSSGSDSELGLLLSLISLAMQLGVHVYDGSVPCCQHLVLLSEVRMDSNQAMVVSRISAFITNAIIRVLFK
jgi:hypothetical protein